MQKSNYLFYNYVTLWRLYLISRNSITIPLCNLLLNWMNVNKELDHKKQWAEINCVAASTLNVCGQNLWLPTYINLDVNIWSALVRFWPQDAGKAWFVADVLWSISHLLWNLPSLNFLLSSDVIGTHQTGWMWLFLLLVTHKSW